MAYSLYAILSLVGAARYDQGYDQESMQPRVAGFEDNPYYNERGEGGHGFQAGDNGTRSPPIYRPPRAAVRRSHACDYLGLFGGHVACYGRPVTASRGEHRRRVAFR